MRIRAPPGAHVLRRGRRPPQGAARARGATTVVLLRPRSGRSSTRLTPQRARAGAAARSWLLSQVAAVRARGRERWRFVSRSERSSSLRRLRSSRRSLLVVMSGRGKGGKGLGKGGAKRHRKVLRDNIQVRRGAPAIAPRVVGAPTPPAITPRSCRRSLLRGAAAAAAGAAGAPRRCSVDGVVARAGGRKGAVCRCVARAPALGFATREGCLALAGAHRLPACPRTQHNKQRHRSSRAPTPPLSPCARRASRSPPSAAWLAAAA